MAVLSVKRVEQPKMISQVVHWDLGDYSRDTVTIASGNDIVIGQVLGVLTADSSATIYDNSASDGSEVATLIALEKVDASDAAISGVAVSKRVTTLLQEGLVFESGISQSDIDDAIADLDAFGFKIQEGIG